MENQRLVLSKLARARGQSGVEFVSELLSIIIRDDLVAAVLDEEEA